MEKKTIGGFIAALRKANGMTQRELAERLNVSDKTVSRWERDDGAPDLSTIPVIAEIFDVTCDELLRGERKSPAERVERPEENETSPKGQKQRQRLLKATFAQYQNRTYIAMGVSVAGMIAALICNLAFLEAVLGFLIGTIFFAASIVCQAIFINKAFLSVEDAGIDEASLSEYKRKVVGLAEKSIGLTVFFIGFAFPLIWVDANWGLGSGSLLIWGTIIAAVFILIYSVILYFVKGALLKKGIYSFSDKEMETYSYNRRLKRKCFISLVVILAVTLVFQGFGCEMIWSVYNLSSAYGITFEDYESFVEFMEQDIPYDADINYYADSYAAAGELTVAPESSTNHESIEWYDENGNAITEEEALTRTIEDANGNVVCTYIERNESVSSIIYTPRDGTVLPIRVLSNGDYRAAARLSDLINTAYCVFYPIELLAVLLAYFRKRVK